jgi:hypothetical protein
MTFFKRLWAAIFGGLKNVLDFLLPVLKSQAGEMINVLLPVALEIVMGLAGGQLPSDEKRKAALEMLMSEASRRGLQVATSTLNLIIEMAVARLKASPISQ